MTWYDTYVTVSKPLIGIKEVCLILNCSRNKASNIINDVCFEIRKQNIKILNLKPKQVPTKYVLEYLNMDLDYITKMALQEQKLKINN